jgi:hypothetical protein
VNEEHEHAELASDTWEISDVLFPVNGSATEQLRFLVHYAVLAPSGHNTQPWLFRSAADSLELHADRARALPVVDPQDRELVMSCGAALFHLRVAVRRFGYAEDIKTLPDATNPDLLARVRLGQKRSPTGEDSLLFESILKRRTNRMPFETRKVPTAMLSSLRVAAEEEGAWFFIAEGDDTRNGLADLISEGDRRQGADPRFRRELSAWLHPNRTRSRDGIPGYAFGFGEIFSYVGPLVIRTFDWGKGQAAKDRQLAFGSPVLAVLGTAEDSPLSWLSAGQALARVLLRARIDYVWASFLNQPIEVAELRPRVAALTKLPGFPQLLIRMGYGPEVRPTPRRTVKEVLLS